MYCVTFLLTYVIVLLYSSLLLVAIVITLGRQLHICLIVFTAELLTVSIG